jgi:hypothetical protein
MKVRFTTADEFLEELGKEYLQVEDGILRLTFQHQLDLEGSLDSLSVYAGVVVRGKIVEVRQFIGRLWRVGNDEGDQKVWEQAQNVHDRISTKARDLNLEVRAGVFEE